MFKLTFPILVIIIFFSCNNRYSNNDNIASKFNVDKIKTFVFDESNVNNLNIKKVKSSIIVDSIFSPNVHFIRLETNKECLIGQIDKIFFTDSLIFVIDKRITKSVYVFNSRGDYKFRISERGKGPSEYIDIQDVEINKWKKQVAILDGYSRKINYYTYSGEFINSHSTAPLILYSLANIDSLIYLFDKGRYHENDQVVMLRDARLFCSDMSNIYSKGISIEKETDNFHWNTLRQLWKFDDRIFFNKPFHDTIYRITKDTIYADYFLNLNGDNIPYKEKLKLTDEQFIKYKEYYAYFNGDFIDLNDFAYFQTIYPDACLHTFYSKKSGNLISGIDFKMENPFFHFMGKPIAIHRDNTIVVLAEANYLKKFIWEECPVKDKYPYLKKKFNSLVNGLNDTDNPTLILYTLKDF